jgi:hypothetical protein
MTLAATFGLYLISLASLNLGWLPSNVHGFARVTSSDSSAQQNPDAAASQPQTPSQSAAPAPAPAPTGQTPDSPSQNKPSPTAHRRHKKTPPNCSNSPTALNPVVGTPADSQDPAGAGSSNPASAAAESTNTASPALKPCPPPRKVVRNGGSEEPTVQLTGGTSAEQAVHQRSTDQLTVATKENLKKIAGRQLNPSQQELVSQIKQFMEQSKTAVAAGDLERGHKLALKAHLLSDELVKP